MWKLAPVYSTLFKTLYWRRITVGLLNKSAHGAVGEGISEKCGTPSLHRKARSLET